MTGARYHYIWLHMPCPLILAHIATMADLCILIAYYLYTVIYGIISFIGFIGNLASFMTFRSFKQQTSVMFLLQALSIIDIFLLVTIYAVVFMQAYGYMMSVISTSIIHAMAGMQILAYMAHMSTIWTTVLISIHRYIAVTKPLYAAMLCSISKAKSQLSITVSLAVAYNLIKCYEFTDMPGFQYYEIAYRTVAYIIIYFVIPLVILIYVNINLLRVLELLQSVGNKCHAPHALTRYVQLLREIILLEDACFML